MGNFICFLLLGATILGSPEGLVPEQSRQEREVILYVDGCEVDTSGLSYLEGDECYVPLREVCTALGAQVSWQAGETTVTAEGLEMLVVQDGLWIEANERFIYTPLGCRNVDGKMMVPLSAVCRAFGAGVIRLGKAWLVKSGGEPILSGREYYSADDVYWLSRIIKAEAGAEPFEGKIAVAEVVLNRVESDDFPDSVYGVIFDKRFGVQFTPAYNGAIYNRPDAECIIAAKLALDGAGVMGNSIYFNSTSAASYCWAGKNRDYLGTIGEHCF